MNQCTVRLDDDYELQDGHVVLRECVWDYDAVDYPADDGKGGSERVDYPAVPCEIVLTPVAINVGAMALLYSVTDVSPDALRRGGNTERFHLTFDAEDVEHGMAGNSNRAIRRFHGWRGTTNDRSVTALGVRRVVRIRELKNGQVAVTVGRDLKPNDA